jgi:pilus assembly protein CpaE
MTELRPVGPAVAEQLPFLGFARDAESRKALGMAAAARGWAAPDIREGDLEGAQAAVARASAPVFLVIDLTDCPAPLGAVDALADLCPEGTRVLAIGTHNDVQLYRGLKQLGVSDYLLKPLDAPALEGAIAEALADRGQAGRQGARAPHKGEVLAVIGARGGVGATALALSLAHLSAAGGNRTMLLDLDLQGGTVALDLEAEPVAGLLAILESPDRVDGQLLESLARAHRLGFRVLAAEEPVELQPKIRPESVLALLATLVATHDLVVVDLPRRLDRTVRSVLRNADRVLVVTSLSLAGLRDTRRLAGLLAGLRAGQRPLLVANRVGASRAEVALADFERGLEAKIDLLVPDAPAAAARAAAAALPLSAAAGKARPAGALAQLAALAAPAAAQPPAARRARPWARLVALARGG